MTSPPVWLRRGLRSGRGGMRSAVVVGAVQFLLSTHWVADLPQRQPCRVRIIIPFCREESKEYGSS